MRPLKKFLEDPKEKVFRHPARQDLRPHLEGTIRHHRIDVDCRTEETGRPYALVCTKNAASYEARLKTFHRDQEHLAALRHSFKPSDGHGEEGAIIGQTGGIPVDKLAKRLRQALARIDRPGDFCTSGSFPTRLPGLEVEGVGPVALPLTARQAKDLKKVCEQTPYGKGTATLVDTAVRRVWRLKPERFTLANPDWQPFLQEITGKVRQGLGLEDQALESHLYELLLYEPGSFFLPHKDGEKLGRMVATLVVVLPSHHQGGAAGRAPRRPGEGADARHGEEVPERHVHYAAFYADCEHEVPAGEGVSVVPGVQPHAEAGEEGRGGAGQRGGRRGGHGPRFRGWAAGGPPRKLVVTLDHQYTQEGLVVDALKGADRAARGHCSRRPGRRAATPTWRP